MLQELRVNNYALLDNVSAPFENGFNVLSGETGAGKSLLAGALGLLLGEKADSQFIRHGCDEAEVSGLIVLNEQSEAALWLAGRGIRLDDGAIVIRRVLKRNGRGAIYVGASIMSRDDLAVLASMIFDMHGQHEHQSLYNKENQRRILDKAAAVTEEVAAYAALFQKVRTLKDELTALLEERRRTVHEQEFLRFALNEIESVNPDPEERDMLSEKLKSMGNKEKILDKLNRFGRLTTGHEGALTLLREAAAILDATGEVFTENKEHERFKSALLELEDAAQSVMAEACRFDFSADELEAMQERLSAMQRLEKKYGGSMAALQHFIAEARSKLENFENSEDDEIALRKAIESAESELKERALNISQKRKARAVSLQEAAEASLRQLEMEACRFVIDIKPRQNKEGGRVLTASGMDDVEFLFAPNRGEGLKPLKTIASGGEASRILLALKSVLAEDDTIDCLIFDEIDTGIGGSAARAVARHLQKLAEHKQVLVITHLATIAAAAEYQLKIEKNSYLNTTITTVTPISKEERVAEIARMLSGRNDEAATAHARALIADSLKNNQLE
jgi:DNA repair protein RecN (Recombination protein N)